MVYSSCDNKKIKDIKKLNLKKYRDLKEEFLIEGEHLVEEAYRAGYLKELILEENISFSLDVPTIYVTDNVLKYISELEHPQKIMGICKKIDKEDIGSRVLILDNIQDPGNLGTIIRSSVAFNIDTIILSPNSVDLYNPKVIRATQGMIFNINIYTDDIASVIGKLKNKKYKVYGTKVNGGNELKSIEKVEKFAIIMGNEGNGVNKNILNLCDSYIHINMNKSCESLNVAVATSIILYELNK